MNAARDENNRTTIICASSADGQTIISAIADPSCHCLYTEDGTSGTDNGNNGGNAMLDQNGVPVWTALSSDGSGSIIEVYANPATGAVLTDSF